MGVLRALCGAAVLAAAPWASLAEAAQTFNLGDPQAVVQLLGDEGFRAKLDHDDRDRPVITSGIGGMIFTIRFHNCDAQKNCTDLLFSALFDTENGFSLTKLNEWNREVLMGRGYTDKDCDQAADHYILIHADHSKAQSLEELLV